MTWLAWSLGGFSLLITFGFLLLSIWHLRRLRRAGADRAGKVSLVLALRGDQPGLAALLMMVVTEGTKLIFRASASVVARWLPFFAVTVYWGLPSRPYQ